MKELDKCQLCMRKCLVNRNIGEVGACLAPNKMVIARASLHEWEEPCISGTNGSGTIFFSGCNLKCVFCQNYDISTNLHGREISTQEFATICLNLEKMGAHNINLVTPTPYIPLIASGLRLAKEKGLSIPIVYNTSSYESVDSLKLLDGLIDIYLPDFKYFDDIYSLKYSSVSAYCDTAKKAIFEMFRQVGVSQFNKDGIMLKGVIVRHLMIPTLKDDSKKILSYLYNTYHDDIYISIMNQYTPIRTFTRYPELNDTITDSDYDEVINYALDLGIKNAFIQEGGTVDTSFIPDFLNQSLPL